MLTAHPKVTQVYYPGLPEHPGHEIAAKQMRAFGGMVSFRVAGGEQAAVEVCNRAQLFTLGESLGGVESLIEHPGRMTHASAAGSALEVPADLVRLSVGIESVDDLLADLRAGARLTSAAARAVRDRSSRAARGACPRCLPVVRCRAACPRHRVPGAPSAPALAAASGRPGGADPRRDGAGHAGRPRRRGQRAASRRARSARRAGDARRPARPRSGPVQRDGGVRPVEHAAHLVLLAVGTAHVARLRRVPRPARSPGPRGAARRRGDRDRGPAAAADAPGARVGPAAAQRRHAPRARSRTRSTGSPSAAAVCSSGDALVQPQHEHQPLLRRQPVQAPAARTAVPPGACGRSGARAPAARGRTGPRRAAGPSRRRSGPARRSAGLRGRRRAAHR